MQDDIYLSTAIVFCLLRSRYSPDVTKRNRRHGQRADARRNSKKWSESHTVRESITSVFEIDSKLDVMYLPTY
jgi:hypothetical protein